MSRCMVTGANGFLGRHLVERLIQDGHEVTLLIRNPKQAARQQLLDQFRKQAEVAQKHGRSAAVSVWDGDMGKPGLGLDAKCLFTDFHHVYHLAAVYDLGADETATMQTNVGGTEELLQKLDQDRFTGCLHFVSSVAVAGDFKGEFSERMFDEGQSHAHVYNRSKYESERLVREKRAARNEYEIRIYRPSAIVGHSRTGEMDRIDGPYYGFLLVSALKRIFPSWLPLAAPKIKSLMDIVPVDYVAQGLFTISMLDRSELPDDLYCFHLTDPNALSMTKITKLVLKAADGPQIQFTVGTDWAKPYLKMMGKGADLKTIEMLKDGLLGSLGIPSQALDAVMPDVRFGAAETVRLLQKNGVILPEFPAYVETLWDYYNRHLDPDRNKEEQCEQAFRGKVVLITGGSEGIGFMSAGRSVAYGARVILAARNQDKLDQALQELAPIAEENGGSIEAYTCNIASLEECDALIAHVLGSYGRLDILFNNAGLSIRRSIGKALDRFHDYERTMQTNYFGPLRLVLGFLPSMIERRSGHILYSSTMGTLAPTPRFGAYAASKSAMDAISDSMAAEFADRNIYFTSIKFPMVKTGMLAPTRDYDDMPAATPEAAAQMFVDAVRNKSRKQMTGLGMAIGLINLIKPNMMTQVYNYFYQIWPDAKEDYPEMEQDRKLVKKIVPATPI